MTAPSDPNPYEPPRFAGESTPNFRDSDSEVGGLRRRVEELEKRLGRNWLVSPSQFKRVFGVVGYFFAGYMLIGGIAWVCMLLINLVMYLLGRPGPFW
jgi:hypothetical protein